MPLRYTAPQTGGGPPVGPQLWQLKGAAPSDIELNTLAGANGIDAVNPQETTLKVLFNKVAGLGVAVWQWASGGATMTNGINLTASVTSAGSAGTGVGSGGQMVLSRKFSTGDFRAITSINKTTKTSTTISDEEKIESRVADTGNVVSSFHTQKHDSIDLQLNDSLSGDQSQQFQKVDKIFRTVLTADDASETNEEPDTINRTVIDSLAGTQSIMDQRAGAIFEELQGVETNTLESEHDFSNRTIDDTVERSEIYQEKKAFNLSVNNDAANDAGGLNITKDGVRRFVFVSSVQSISDAVEVTQWIVRDGLSAPLFAIDNTGKITTNQSEALAAVDVSLASRIPIRDGAGVLLGYIPVMVDP